MGKARVAVLLAAAYGVGVAVLVVVALVLPAGTLCTALHRVPEVGHRAALLVRVAAHAGTLGLKHMPFFEPQGVSPRKHSVRFCVRERPAGCGSAVLPELAPVPTRIVRLLVENDG
jgi:hypothetical protein